MIRYLLCLLVCGTAFAEPVTNTFPAYRRLVMTWVAPYAVKPSRDRLAESFGSRGMKDGLTHLGLRFWQPTTNGTLTRFGNPADTGDEVVAAIRDQAHTNGVRVMLCVFNAMRSVWDWPRARAAFKDHPDEFVKALVAETRRLKLDGVDIDLEGNGNFEADRPAFVAFMKKLSTRLHALNLHLTVDSFAYVWNAPNHNWWPDLLPLVDGLTTMGYDETGAGAPEWRSFVFQKAAACDHASRLMIGLPASRPVWQGRPLKEHLDWLLADGSVGVSFWDAQLKGAPWRTEGTWSALEKIRGRR